MKSDTTHRIVVVDDQAAMRNAMVEKISFFDEFEIVAVAQDGLEAVSSTQKNRPDVLLMDIRMPHMDGIEATLAIKSEFPEMKVLITTVMDDNENIFHAIRAGADGYLLKDADPAMLRDAILEVLDGGAPLSPNVARKALQLLRTGAEPTRKTTGSKDQDLTEREREILAELSKGKVYTEIARELFIAPGTVRKHVENIYRKMQVHSKVEALDQARRRGLF